MSVATGIISDVTASDLRHNVRSPYMRRLADSDRFGGNRLAALVRDEWRCVSCGMTNDEHVEAWGCTLTIDHIDGQGRNSAEPNSALDNLQTLCLRCHGAKDGKRADYSLRNTATGERHGGARLTVDSVRAMRAERSAGAIYAALADKYGVTITTAHAVCTRKTWKEA